MDRSPAQKQKTKTKKFNCNLSAFEGILLMTHIMKSIQEDGVAMRWIRTAATTVTALAAATAVLLSVAVYVFAPRFDLWATDLIDGATEAIQETSTKNAAHLLRLDDVVVRLEQNVNALSTAVARDMSPSWRFSMPDTSISDGVVGGKVSIRAAGYKLRDCGVPVVDLYFINGGGVYHRFEAASVLSSNNRGIPLQPDPSRLQSVTYVARIPADDGVTAGRGNGYISVTYPDSCPAVEAAIAGPLQFRIGATE